MKSTSVTGRPCIGITCSRRTGGAWGVHSLGHFLDFAYAEYSEAVLDAGGAPFIIPVAQDESSMASLLDAMDGLILSGGADVHPRHYGEETLPGLGEVDAALDRMELLAAKMALERNLPILGICRGVQLLNVALGGTLYQHIPAQVPDALGHVPPMDKAVHAHTIRILPGTRLRQIIGRAEIWVNSAHHQSVKAPAPSCVVSAHARDGVIEAIEVPDRTFALGVQWHPEGTWRDDRHAKQLFRALVQAAIKGGRGERS